MKVVGFDQKILLHHLDFATQKLNEIPIKNMHSLLDEYLMSDIKGTGTRRCAHAIIMKIWWSVEGNHRFIRDHAHHIYPILTKTENQLLHWCMTCLAYPFFKEQVNYLGKHLRMADEVRSRVVLAEMKNLYGDRRRVEVATSAVFSTIKNWNIVKMTSPGVYQMPEKRIEINSSELKNLMVEVLMDHLDTNSVILEMVNNSAIFFPFDYHISTGDLNEKRFTIIKNIRDTIIERNPKIPYSFE
ncbi:hypothetical protein [Paenisporosarcina sp. TG20]|uniref:hypothetical protein n=1 Tax=Paenisporosarcina sp. TG20 TaxID=1211706 RepID=UPI0002DEA4F2|nr:hypothetical protein [Paenisporosarcina sp. TG20]